MAKSQKTLSEKVQEAYPEFADMVERMNVADLEKRLTTNAKYREEIMDAKENNEALKSAKERVAEIQGPINDSLKALTIQNKYIVHLIKEKGGQ